MELRAMELTEKHAKELSTWKYHGKYEIYNLPCWETMLNEGYALYTSYLSFA